jgi:hypothetical protein
MLAIVSLTTTAPSHRDAFALLDSPAAGFKLLGRPPRSGVVTPWRFERSVLHRLPCVEDDVGKRAREYRPRAKAAVLDLFRGRGPAGDTSGNSPGTKWAAANAIAEYADFGRRCTKRTDQIRIAFGGSGSSPRHWRPMRSGSSSTERT